MELLSRHDPCVAELPADQQEFFAETRNRRRHSGEY
jgi:hypothetical protein